MNSLFRSAICLGLCPALLSLCPSITVEAAERPATSFVIPERPAPIRETRGDSQTIPLRDPVREFAKNYLDRNSAERFSNFVESTGVVIPANEDSGRPLLFLLLILAIATGAIP